MTDEKYAEIAYEGYRSFLDDKCPPDGELLPPWVELSKEVQAAWKAAAVAVIEA